MLLVEKLLGSSSAAPNYIEDVFSTYLYTGDGATQTITNGIDLSTKGGLVWIKRRAVADGHSLYDTVRGVNKEISSSSTFGQTTTTSLPAFNTNGFNVASGLNTSANLFNSWAFRKQAKFFDIVTYTGTGANRTVAHNLGSVPGCIITKRLDTTGNWITYHRSLGNTDFVNLNTTAATAADSTAWNNTSPTSTEFSLGTGNTNVSGGTYVAYLFAHNAGGFGAADADNVISCGSFTTDASGNASVSLGYEPQWCVFKRTSNTSNWTVLDNIRGWVVGGNDTQLQANTTGAETSASNISDPNATGFSVTGLSISSTYIYIAIRRGPMKTPTSGTSVLGLNARTGTGADATVTGGQTDDLLLVKNRGSAVANLIASRLTGTGYLTSTSTAIEATAGATMLQANPWDVMDGVKVGTTSTTTNASTNTFINYLFRRAPGFFDVVCYTGTGAAQNVSHNLGAVPELMIVKARNSLQLWPVYASAVGNTQYLRLNTTDIPFTDSTVWNNTTPTSSVFTVGSSPTTGASGTTYIAYLFASLAGVSKIGSYTGNGTAQTINCGFTGGARFVMIKRTDSTTTANWYVWDTARGIVAGNDPYIMLNAINGEITTSNSIGPDSTGFIVSQDTGTNINVNASTYIFLAIA